MVSNNHNNIQFNIHADIKGQFRQFQACISFSATTAYTVSSITSLFKRKARANWQRTHAPSDRRNYNASHKLKAALYKLRNDNFTEYISNLKSTDQSIWKPLISQEKTKHTDPPQSGKTPHHRPMGKK